MVVAFYFRLHLAYFPRPVVAIFARPEQRPIFAIFLLVKRPFPCYTTVIRLFPRKLSILRGRKG